MSGDSQLFDAQELVARASKAMSSHNKHRYALVAIFGLGLVSTLVPLVQAMRWPATPAGAVQPGQSREETRSFSTVNALTFQGAFYIAVIALLIARRSELAAVDHHDIASLCQKIQGINSGVLQDGGALEVKDDARAVLEGARNLAIPKDRLLTGYSFAGLAFLISAMPLLNGSLLISSDDVQGILIDTGAGLAYWGLGAIACAAAAASYGLLGRRKTSETRFVEDLRGLRVTLDALCAVSRPIPVSATKKHAHDD